MGLRNSRMYCLTVCNKNNDHTLNQYDGANFGAIKMLHIVKFFSGKIDTSPPPSALRNTSLAPYRTRHKQRSDTETNTIVPTYRTKLPPCRNVAAIRVAVSRYTARTSTGVPTLGEPILHHESFLPVAV